MSESICVVNMSTSEFIHPWSGRISDTWIPHQERMTFADISQGELLRTASASLAPHVVGAALFASMIAVDLDKQMSISDFIYL